MAESHEIIEQIRAAFAGTVRPAPDDFLHCDACEIWLERFLESPTQRWEDLSADDIAYEYNAPTAVTPAGFRFLLPAFMIWHIKNPTSGAKTSGHLLYQLTFHAEHAQETLPKFQALSPGQVQSVVSFLCYVAAENPDEHSRESARTALKSYWQRADA